MGIGIAVGVGGVGVGASCMIAIIFALIYRFALQNRFAMQ